MKQIYVLDDNNQPQLIDAGATSYAELSDLPIQINTLNTTVTLDGDKIVTNYVAGHRWSLEELNLFCGIVDGVFSKTIQVVDGRYDIITEDQGHEILLIDTVQVAGIDTRRVRRITAQYDWIYDERGKTWLNISDDSAGSLIFSMVTPPENITYGTAVELEYSYYSATGKIGTIQLYINDTLKATVSRNSSTTPYIMDITNYLGIGENNVLLTVQSGDNKEELFAKINVINLTLTSTFDANQLYQGNSLNYTYNLVGSIEKTIYFQFDDEEPTSKTYSKTTNAVGAIQQLDTTNLTHGIHTLKTWAEAYIGTTLIETPVLSYTLPIWKDAAEGTILVLNSAPESIEQGATAVIAYTPYHATETSVTVKLSYPSEFGLEDVELVVPVSVQRNWSFLASTIGDFNFTITSGITELVVPMTIVLGEQINYEEAGLLYSLDLIGRDNAFANRDVIEYKTIDVDQSKVSDAFAKVDDFNFSTDGWLTDSAENNRNILRVNATSMVTYPNMNLFTLLSNTNYSGCSFEIDFKGRNTTNSNRKLVTLLTSANQGITVNEQSVTVTLAGSTYSVEYKAEERTRITITIGRNVDDARHVMIYLNGVLSFVSTYTSASFAGYVSDLIINPIAGFVDIYGLRLYGSELTMGQVLNNYIASFNSSAEKITARDWNAIYTEDGSTVKFDNVKKLMPTFVFTTNDVDGKNDMPPQKGEKRYGPVDYIDPTYRKDFSEAYNGKKEKPVADVQGTSSQKYPRKNFKIKTNNKHSMNDAIVGEKVFTFKKDFMDSSHANNTGLAKLVQTLYFTPVPPQISYILWLDADGNKHDAYDIEGNKIDFKYIYDYAASIGDPFSSLSAVNIEVTLLNEDGKAYFAYNKKNNATQHRVCEINTEGLEASSVEIKDKSYVRTTIFGQPCAFFWHPLGGERAGEYIYQGIYNFNIDKVAANNMELEEEGCLSFEFVNNVTGGVLFKSCENFTEIRNSFEYRAYEKDGVSLGLWEDYYADDEEVDSGLVTWANGGYDEEEETDIPILNALYGTVEGVEYQLFTKINDVLKPINYPLVTANIEAFKESDPRTLEIDYRLNEGVLEAAFVASTGQSDDIKIKDTIEDLGGDAYYEERGTTPAPSGLSEGEALGVQIINSGVDYIVQWGYETNGSVSEWVDYCYVDDLLTTIPEELQGKVSPADVGVLLKSGKLDDLRWNYKYPVDRTWETIATADNIFNESGELVTPTTLRKYDLYELMHQPIMDVVNWVIDCWKDYETTNSTKKFTQEFENHLNKEYVITYYVMGLFAGAADSFAKNMFWNSYDGGHIWYPVYYDIDTCFGLSNDGHPNFPYSLEIYGDGSKLGAADIYNGAKSNFWKLVYASYAKEIQAKYNELRVQRLSYESVMDVLYNQQIALIAPAHYNEDAKFSYLNYPSYYYTAQGSRYERLKYWVESRFAYLDSKMEYTDYTKDSFELRSNAGLPLEVTPDMTMFIGVKYGQHVENITKKRCEANGTVSFNPRDYGVTNVNDLETLIYGASHIKSLGDLSAHQVTSIKFPDIGKSVLESIVIGSEEAGYSNTNFTTLAVGSNSLLKVLNVSNCTNLGKESSVLDLSKCPSIQTVLARKTLLTNIKLPEGCPIRQLHLPSVQEIELINQILLSDLTIDNYAKISKLVWDNVPKSLLKVEDILTNIYELEDNSVLNEVRIINYENSKPVTTAWMDWFMRKNGINDSGGSTNVPYVTGCLTVQSLDKSALSPYISQFNTTINDKFAYVTTFDKETETYQYFKYDSITSTYEEITLEETKQYKLNILLEQLVASENIFGVSGEGE